jgi:hypothetical protein
MSSARVGRIRVQWTEHGWCREVDAVTLVEVERGELRVVDRPELPGPILATLPAVGLWAGFLETVEALLSPLRYRRRECEVQARADDQIRDVPVCDEACGDVGSSSPSSGCTRTLTSTTRPYDHASPGPRRHVLDGCRQHRGSPDVSLRSGASSRHEGSAGQRTAGRSAAASDDPRASGQIPVRARSVGQGRERWMHGTAKAWIRDAVCVSGRISTACSGSTSSAPQTSGGLTSVTPGTLLRGSILWPWRSTSHRRTRRCRNGEGDYPGDGQPGADQAAAAR